MLYYVVCAYIKKDKKTILREFFYNLIKPLL